MDASQKDFFARLHREHLKPAGWKKERLVFTRVHADRTERVQFQGSAWNSRGGAWRCYVNFGVAFAGLPARTPDRDLPGTHCWARLETLVPGAPSELDIPAAADGTAADDQRIAHVAALLHQASERVGSQVEGLRRRYEETRRVHLALE